MVPGVIIVDLTEDCIVEDIYIGIEKLEAKDFNDNTVIIFAL